MDQSGDTTVTVGSHFRPSTWPRGSSRFAWLWLGTMDIWDMYACLLPVGYYFKSVCLPAFACLLSQARRHKAIEWPTFGDLKGRRFVWQAAKPSSPPCAARDRDTTAASALLCSERAPSARPEQGGDPFTAQYIIEVGVGTVRAWCAGTRVLAPHDLEALWNLTVVMFSGIQGV